MSDLVLYNGRLITVDPATEGATALAVRNGKIEAVGRDEDILSLAGNGRRVNLEGGALLPGFNDAHIHLWKVGNLLTGMVDLRGVGSITEIKERLRGAAERLGPGAWLLARGYNEALLEEKRHPTAADLDDAVPGRPVWLVRTCAHIGVASTAAMRAANIDSNTAAPPGGVIERGVDGVPNGIFHETAIGLVSNTIPPPTRDDYQRMIDVGGRHLLSLGITSATDPAVTPDLIEAYTGLDGDRKLPLRMNLMAIVRPDGGTETLPLPRRSVSPMLRLDSVKFFADGGLSGATAALKRDYRHAATRGVLRFEDEEELYDLARNARKAGFRVGTHAIGDEAIDQVLRIYSRLAREIPGQANRIEHLGLPDEGMLGRAASIGVIAVAQAIFLEELGANFRAYLPDDYLPRVYPLRSVINAGVPLALSSDAPVVKEINPLAGVRAAVTRIDKTGVALAAKESLTVMQALYAYTLGGAIASGDASNRGTLAPGKWADMVVLSKDPREVEPAALPSIKVMKTYLAGRLVYEG